MRTVSIQVLREDLEYSHATDATQDNYQINELVDKIFERLLSFIPNSDGVTIKKKCSQLGYNSDGTSPACNQGDINALNLTKLHEVQDRITTPIGYFDINDTLAPNNDYLFITHLEVKPELRGQGHFKELLNSISQEAIKRHKNNIAFDPDISQGKEYSDKLNSIYKKHGFSNDPQDPSLLVKSLNENHRPTLKYGVLMANFPFTENQWSAVTSMIDTDDLYTEENGYGLEEEPHITVLYGLHGEVKFDDVLKIVKSGHTKFIKVELSAISIFENEKYDVVKFEANSPQLNELNKNIKLLPHTSSFPDYKPHMTIAYVQKGKGKKYAKKFKRPYSLTSTELIFSDKDKNQKTISL